MKKIASVLLAAALALSLCGIAFADGEESGCTDVNAAVGGRSRLYGHAGWNLVL